MEDLKFRCPHCQGRTSAPASLLGTTIECPSCGGEILFTPPPQRTPPKALPQGRQAMPQGRQAMPWLRVQIDFVLTPVIHFWLPPAIKARFDAATEPGALQAGANLLAELHKWTQMVVEGEGTQAQAVEKMRRLFDRDGRALLEAGGWAKPEEAGQRITELASNRCLELIVGQNVSMAFEVRNYRGWARSRETFPYGRWRHCNNYYREPGEPCLRHLDRDGKVYPFEHPVWRVSPPGGEFGCCCSRDDLTREQVEGAGLPVEPLDSGFEPGSIDFDPGAGFDLPSTTREPLPPELRAELLKALGMPPEVVPPWWRRWFRPPR